MHAQRAAIPVGRGPEISTPEKPKTELKRAQPDMAANTHRGRLRRIREPTLRSREKDPI
jgi:hypothetical protein